MYLGVLTLIVGWAVLLTSPLIICYALVLAVGFHLRVLTYEEPWLARQFGGEWQQYRSHVGRWLPRLTPWNGGPGQDR
jgi:protein-S-isoprenylcysteine O-methyltransferase Ste14